MAWYDSLLPDCQACSKKTWKLYCDSCFKKFQFQRLCVYCAQNSTADSSSCIECKNLISLVEPLSASFFYEGPVAEWIKYLKTSAPFRPWAELTSCYLPQVLDPGKFEAIAFVPSSRGRRCSPSEELARHLSRTWNNKPVFELFSRKKFLKNQAEMNLKDRQFIVSKTFELKIRPAFHRWLLVDDIMTTGASLFGCARLIREAVPDCRIQAYVVARQKKLL